MFSAFFGNYLLNKNKVSPKELSRVLENQKQIRLKLGVLAVNSGFMTSTHVNEVHEMQRRYDRRFGDIAIEKGYLSEETLLCLLAQQKSEHLLLAQALIDDGIMTMNEFEEEIHAYQKDYELTNSDFEALKNDDVEAIIHAFSNFETPHEAENYSQVLSTFVKTIVRFVDSHIRLDRLVKIPFVDYEHVFTQTISTTKDIFIGFSGELDAILEVASKYAEEEFTELDDYAIDSASEFLNLSNGLFVVNKSDEGQDIHLNLQKYEPRTDFKPKGNMYRIPIYLQSGVIDLIVGEK